MAEDSTRHEARDLYVKNEMTAVARKEMEDLLHCEDNGILSSDAAIAFIKRRHCTAAIKRGQRRRRTRFGGFPVLRFSIPKNGRKVVLVVPPPTSLGRTMPAVPSGDSRRSSRIRKSSNLPHMWKIPLLALLLLCPVASGQDVTTTTPVQFPTLSPARTVEPSLRPSAQQTGTPTTAPRPTPTFQPSISLMPTGSMAPTGTMKPTSTMEPTMKPSETPTGEPSGAPSADPTLSLVPTRSFGPSSAPSASKEPSAQPSLSQMPSPAPSQDPTSSAAPSNEPTVVPSDQPSSVPSTEPSANPTGEGTSRGKAEFRQTFSIPLNASFFNDTEKDVVMALFESYTYDFAPRVASVVNTTCEFTGRQDVTVPLGEGIEKRLTITYLCTWSSRAVDVKDYPLLYGVYVNSNLLVVTADMQANDLNVVEAQQVDIIQTATAFPTTTFQPTLAPTLNPTESLSPSTKPSGFPTLSPTMAPVEPSAAPSTTYPTNLPSSQSPTESPSAAPTESSEIPVRLIAGITVGFGLCGLALLALFYFRLKKSRATSAAATLSETQEKEGKKDAAENARFNIPDMVVSPSESLQSNKSLISAPESGLGDESGDENDGTKNLQDEFDQYKDQTLEQFRSNVEGNITGFEGDLSAAVTKALIIRDDDVNVEPNELVWGCEGTPSGVDIEASALCEVNEWLKRNEPVSFERKRTFMKDILNRMVTSVRFGVLKAEDASRSVHESAALLGLPLANELPMTTVIVSGMRKTISAAQMVNVLREFGDIDVAAVASGNRGFGIVRYRNSQSVDRIIRRFREGEIVVLDVAIQMKVLKPSGAVEIR
jgi:hypothetical protein